MRSQIGRPIVKDAITRTGKRFTIWLTKRDADDFEILMIHYHKTYAETLRQLIMEKIESFRKVE